VAVNGALTVYVVDQTFDRVEMFAPSA
jgi:hypothetical protein